MGRLAVWLGAQHGRIFRMMVGQGLWCLAHTLWIGSSFTAFTSALLMAHHVFGCWHGDVRLRTKYGEVCTHAALLLQSTIQLFGRRPGLGEHLFAHMVGNDSG